MPRPRARAAASSCQRRASAPARRSATSAAAKASRAFTCAERSRLAGVRRALTLAALAVMIVAGASASSLDRRPRAARAEHPAAGPGREHAGARQSDRDVRRLDAAQGNVTAGDLTKFYKPETLGLGGAKATHVVKPKAGVTIYRDSFGRAARLREDARRHRVRRGLGDGGGSRALSAAPASARRASRRSTCPATTRSPSRSPPDVRPERADRGVPCDADDARCADGARAPAAEGRRRLHRRHQRVLPQSGRLREAVHAERRHRDRDAHRRRVRRGRR